LSLAGHSGECLCVRRAYPRVEQLKGNSLKYAPAYLQTLDKAENDCQGQTLQLISTNCKLPRRKFFDIGPNWCRCYKTFIALLLLQRQNKLESLFWRIFYACVKVDRLTSCPLN